MSMISETKEALWAYIKNNWTETDVHWPGSKFQTQDHAEWIQVSLSGVDQGAMRSPEDELRAVDVEINVFCKFGTSLYRTDEISSAVIAMLEHKSISVSGSITRMLRLREASLNDVPNELDLQQHSIRLFGTLERT